MAIIKTETTFGGQAANDANGGVGKSGYAIALECELEFTPDSISQIVGEGFKSLLYRGGASQLLSLFGKGAKSSDVTFEADKATEIASTLEKWFAAKCPTKRGEAWLDNAYEVTITVTEYVPGEGTTPKYAKAKIFVADYLKAKAGRTVEVFASNRKIALPADVAKWQEDMEFLKSVQTWLVEDEKQRLAAME